MKFIIVALLCFAVVFAFPGGFDGHGAFGFGLGKQAPFAAPFAGQFAAPIKAPINIQAPVKIPIPV